MPSAPSPSGISYVRTPVVLVLDVEALDARHHRRHRGRVVEHAPDRFARRGERPLALDLHRASTLTRSRLRLRVESSSQTRWYGLQLSWTIGFPRELERVLQRRADRVDPGTAALAHPLRAQAS